MKPTIDKCPHCNGTAGVYTKVTIIGVQYKMGFDGSEQYNSEMYDTGVNYKGGLIIYCQECDKQICRASTFNKQLTRRKNR